MPRAHAAPDKLLHQADQAVQKAGPWIQRAARFGLAIKGLLYCLIGAIALGGSVGYLHNVRPDKSGAFEAILTHPFGRTILSIIAAGLFAFCLWQMISTLFDLEHDGRDWKALSKRAGRFFVAIAYGAIGIGAVKSIIGYARAASADQVHDWTAWALAEPMGRFAIAAAGLITGGRGIFELYKSINFDPTKRMNTSKMGPVFRVITIAAGRLGRAARGIVFLLLAAFLLAAAFYSDPSQARGLGATLRYVERAPYGPYALFTVSIGLIAYGLFTILQSRYRTIPTRPPKRP